MNWPSIGAVLLASALPAFAQVEKKDETYDLGEVVVTATRPAPVEKVATVRRVDRRFIDRSGSTTLDQALGFVPGVAEHTGGGGLPKIDYRGLRSRHVNLLLDGVPLNAISDGDFDASLIPLELVSGVKVTGGTSSVLYGAGGLGGQINVLTRGGRADGATLTTEFGEGDFDNQRLTLGETSGQTHLFFSGSVSGQNTFPLSKDFEATPLQGPGDRVNADRRRRSAFLSLSHDLPDWKLGLIASYSNGLYGVPLNIFNPLVDPFVPGQAAFERFENYHAFTSQAAARYDAHGPLTGQAQLFYNRRSEQDNRYDDARFSTMLNPTVRGTFQKLGVSNTSGGRAQVGYRFGGGAQLTLGGTTQEDRYDESGAIRDVPIAGAARGGGGGGGGGAGGAGAAAPTFGIRTIATDQKVQTDSTAIEASYPLTRDLELVAGYNHLWFDRTGAENEGDTRMGGFSYQLGQRTRARGSLAHRIRFPAVTQLFDANGGNPALVPETAENSELGIEHTFGDGTIASVVAFREDVTNFIERDPITTSFQNLTHILFRGAELALESRVTSRLTLQANYTYLESKDLTRGLPFEEQQFTPRNRIALAGFLTLPDAITAFFSAKYVADQFFYSRTAPFRKRALDDYTLVNVRVAKVLDRRLSGHPVQLFAAVDNVFDIDYQSIYGFEEPGRLIHGGASFTF